MKPLEEIIHECPAIDRIPARKILESYDMFGIIESTYTLLGSVYSKPEPLLHISSIISNFLTITTNKIGSIQCAVKKSKIEFLTIDLSEIMLREYLAKSSIKRDSLIPHIEDTIRATCKQCNFELLPFEKLLKHKLQSLSVTNFRDTKKTKLKRLSKEKCQTIHWLEKGKLFELIDILRKKKYIKRKKDLFAFFQSTNPNVIVRWNAEKKYHMVYLLYRLFNEKYVQINGNKGYFSCAEQMFCDMEGKPFKRNSLKKISSKICREKEKHIYVRKEVDDIIKKITKGTNGLL